MKILNLTIITILILGGVAMAEEPIEFTMWPEEAQTQTAAASSPSAITFENENRLQAIIDFGGESVTYSGDLPVDESARMFFERLGNMRNCEWCREKS